MRWYDSCQAHKIPTVIALDDPRWVDGFYIASDAKFGCVSVILFLATFSMPAR